MSPGQTSKIGEFARSLGLHRGQTILVHSSFSKLSRQGYRAEVFVEAIWDAVAPGTLMMPAMSWRLVTPQSPTFDELATPSITGILSEVFRTRCASHRSLHPTHSVSAVGSLAKGLTAEHHKDCTPCGEQGPWGRLAGADATIVMLGVGMDSCTLVHNLEESFDPKTYLRDEEEVYQCVDRTGLVHEVTTRRHRKLMRNFWKLEQRLRAEGVVRDAELDGSLAFAFQARDLLRVGMKHMREDAYGTLAAPGEVGKLM